MEFETIPTPLDLSTKEKKEATVLTDESFSDLNFIHLGSGAKSIILDIQTGFYIGAEQFTSAPFSVDFDGKVIASNIEITGGSVSGVSLSGLAAGTDINIFGWTSTMTFSATDYRTVTWTSGVITLADGTTFNIGTGNTGNMAATTYIYFDKTLSITALQITTTAATAVGTNKILIAVAQNNSVTTSEATLQVYGGSGGILLKADNIAAGSITANEIAANTITASQIAASTITASQMNVATLSAISANLGTITAGTITGAVIQTATSGYRIKMNYSTNKLECLNNDTVLGSIYTDANGDININGTDDVNLAIGGTIKCYAASSAFKPNSDETYDLGTDDNGWANIHGKYLHIESDGHVSGTLTVGTVRGDHKSSDGTSGIDTNEDVVTSVWFDSGANKLKYNYRKFTYKDGLLVTKGSENTATAWTL